MKTANWRCNNKVKSTCDDGLIPREKVGEGGVGVVEHEVVLGAGQAHEIDGVAVSGHRDVGQRRALRRPVVQPVRAAVRRLGPATRDLDHQVGAASAPPRALHIVHIRLIHPFSRSTIKYHFLVEEPVVVYC